MLGHLRDDGLLRLLCLSGLSWRCAPFSGPSLRCAPFSGLSGPSGPSGLSWRCAPYKRVVAPEDEVQELRRAGLGERSHEDERPALGVDTPRDDLRQWRQLRQWRRWVGTKELDHGLRRRLWLRARRRLGDHADHTGVARLARLGGLARLGAEERDALACRLVFGNHGYGVREERRSVCEPRVDRDDSGLEHGAERLGRVGANRRRERRHEVEEQARCALETLAGSWHHRHSLEEAG